MKINVSLYGGKSIFGGRETPLEADEIYCDYFNQCTFFKENKCLRCRSFGPSCRFGKNYIIKGYTSRAKKYLSFKSKYQSDEVYNKLSYPKGLVAIMEDTLYMNLKYVLVRKKREDNSYNYSCKCVGNYEITTAGFCSGDCFIPLAELTNEFLASIFSYIPSAMLGGVVTAYQNKVVPEILQDLKRIAPDIYNSFISEYPNYDLAPNYIGKNAYVSSLKPNTIFKYKGVEWLYDGEYVIAENFDLGLKSPWWKSETKCSEIKIKVNDKMLFEVKDNSIIDENTRFE